MIVDPLRSVVVHSILSSIIHIPIRDPVGPVARTRVKMRGLVWVVADTRIRTPHKDERVLRNPTVTSAVLLHLCSFIAWAVLWLYEYMQKETCFVSSKP